MILMISSKGIGYDLNDIVKGIWYHLNDIVKKAHDILVIS